MIVEVAELPELWPKCDELFGARRVSSFICGRDCAFRYAIWHAFVVLAAASHYVAVVTSVGLHRFKG
jgi:predicted membrane channel-forming protein YqfA (hemolysin III family)